MNNKKSKCCKAPLLREKISGCVVYKVVKRSRYYKARCSKCEALNVVKVPDR